MLKNYHKENQVIIRYRNKTEVSGPFMPQMQILQNKFNHIFHFIINSTLQSDRVFQV